MEVGFHNWVKKKTVAFLLLSLDCTSLYVLALPSLYLCGPREMYRHGCLKKTHPSVSFGCHCFDVGVHFLHLLGLSSSSPYQPSPIPTHCYRDIRDWNHHHRDHQAPWRGTLWHSLWILHTQNHLPPWSPWDSERLAALFIPDTEERVTVPGPKQHGGFGLRSWKPVICFYFYPSVVIHTHSLLCLLIQSSVRNPRNPHPSEEGAALKCLAPQEAWARQADGPSCDRNLGGWGGAGPLGDQSLLRKVRGSSVLCLQLLCSINCVICQNNL